MGLTSQAAAVLAAQRVETSALPAPGGVPQPVAFDQDGTYGSVLFLAVSSTGEWMCLLAILEHGDGGWEDLSIVHKPWWDPQGAFAGDELIATGGHSRFSDDLGAEVVVIPGQAATDTSVTSVGPAGRQRPLAQGLWRHFVYVGCSDEPGMPVTLTAERAGAQETVVFEPLDAL
jgi:hypothetical protein